MQLAAFREFVSAPRNVAAIAGVALLAFAVAGAQINLHNVNESLRSERLSLRLISDVEGLQDSLREIEAVREQYLAAGEPTLLARFGTLQEKIRAHLADLENRVEHPELRVALPAVKSAVREYLSVTGEAMAARGSGLKPATGSISPGRVVLSNSAGGLVDAFEQRNRHIISERERDATSGVGFMGRAMLSGVALAALLLGWALWASQRHERARVAAEALLQSRSRELRLLVDAMPAMIAYIDADESVLLHNRAYAQWLDVPSARIDGRKVREVVGEETYAVVAPYLQRALRGEEVRYERQEKLADGGVRDLSIFYVPHRAPGNGVSGCYVLVTDITDVKNLGRLKSEFVAKVSHEIRTPTTAISGSLDMMAGGAAGPLPEAISRLVGIARTNCERLVSLVDDLLDIEKVESGEVALSMRDEDPARLVAMAVAAVGPLAARHRVQIRADGLPAGIRVRADFDHAVRALTNVLTNAIQFSPDGAEVVVSLDARQGAARIAVRDHGRGVPPEFVPRLFEKFSQDASVARGSTGRFGLGLAITKMLVERMDGHIGYEPAPGGGSLFWLELRQPQPAGRRGRELRRILYVEDDDSIRKVGTMALETVGGFQVTECASGAEAIARGPSAAADLILLDVMMPDMDGLQTLERLRAIPKMASTPVVFLTAAVRPAEIARLRAVGAADVLAKPFEPMALPQQLREIWARHTG